MSRLTAERLRELAKWQRDSVAGAWLTPPLLGGDHLALIEHAARVVEAAEQLLHVLYKTSPPDPPWQEDEDALDAALEGTEGE